MNSTLIVIAVLLFTWTVIEIVAHFVTRKPPRDEAVTPSDAQELREYLDKRI